MKFYIKQSLVFYELEHELYRQIVELDSSNNEKILKIKTRQKVLLVSKIKIEQFKRPSNDMLEEK